LIKKKKTLIYSSVILRYDPEISLQSCGNALREIETYLRREWS